MLRRAALLGTALALVFAGSLCAWLAAQETAPPVVAFPQNDPGLASLGGRKEAQLNSVNQFKVFYRFHFTDKLKESGITFREHATIYSTSDYMAIHYDHGTGIAVADVDGDGLYDIYFVSQLGGNELWRNLGNGKFENITEQSGVGMKGRVSVTASFGDVDNSGHQDLYVTTVNEGNVLFQNDGHGHFKDITHEAGLDLVAHSSGSFFFDYDNDGLLDLLVCNVGVYTTNERTLTEPMLVFATHFPAICIPNASSTPCSTKTWVTINSKMLPRKWAWIPRAGAAMPPLRT